MSRLFCFPQVKPLGFIKPSSLMKVSSRFKAHQDALPRLPVPQLQQSLDHYLKALQPIVSEEEWAHTKQLVEEFQTSGGVGERLQKGLERRARKMENWVSEMGGPQQAPQAQGPPELLSGLLLAVQPEPSRTSCSSMFICCSTEFPEYLCHA
jgi:hypothetical protein